MKVTETLFRRIPLKVLALGALALGSTNLFGAFIPVVPANGGAQLAINNLNGALVGVTSVPPCISWSGATSCGGVNTVNNDNVGGTDLTVYAVTSGLTNLGTIKDIFPTQVTPVVNFMTVQGGTAIPGQTVHFDLIAFSPFVLTDDGPSKVDVKFTVTMWGYTGSSGVNYNAATLFSGIFQTTLSGNLPTCPNPLCGPGGTNPFGGLAYSVANVNAYEGAGGTVTSTWSATAAPVPGVPEPVSFLLLGSGLMGLSILGRRFRRP